jgi:hypothetical protein
MRAKRSLIAEVLREFEEAGEAKRYLDRSGRICLESDTQNARQAGCEREALDDLEHDAP